MAHKRAERLSRDERRAQIMDSAVALIVARGLSSCSLEEVAAEAGISKPLIYKYFSSREELLKEILEREYRYLRGRGLDVLPADVSYERVLRAAIQRSMEYLYERGPIMRLLASDRAVTGLVQDRDRDERSGMTRYFADAAIKNFGLSPLDALIITILTVNAPILSARALKNRGIPVARASEVWSDFCDADSHIMETVDWVEKHADPAVREKLPQLALTKAGGATANFINDAVSKQKDRAAKGKVHTDVVRGTKGWGAFGAFDPAERKKAMDDLGFARQLVFSTFSAGQYLSHNDMDVRYGGIRAHNRAMASFCADDKRLIAVGQLSLADPVRCVEELKEGVRIGCGAFWIPGSPVGDKSPGHPDFDIVWQAFVDLKVPFMLHVGPNSPTKLAAYENNGKPRPKDITGAEGGENLRVRDFMLLSVGPQQFLTALVFDGVLERFPALRGGVIELGAGWVPEYLRTLDLSQKIFKRTDASIAELPLKASDYIRRAVKFTPFPGEDVGRMIADAGADLFLFSSDYPHPEGTDDPIGRFERTFKDMSEEAKEKFYYSNFQDMMGAS